jgi:hypothetical protein
VGVRKTPEEDISPFIEFFPKETWTVNNLMGPVLGAHIMCKVCDRYISLKEKEEHLEFHKIEAENLLKKRKKLAEKQRIINIKLAREARRLKNESRDCSSLEV